MKQIIDELQDINVLVVEDGEDIRNIISSTFQKIFHHTYTAVDGVDGVEKYLELKPDIIITDIRMPNMSGNDLVDKIKQIDPNMPIVVVSGHGRLIKRTNKADVFLEKPINFIRLVTEMHRLLKK